MINWPPRHKKVLFPALILVLALATLVMMHWMGKNSLFSPSSGPAVSSSPYRMKIERFRFYGMNDGQKVLYLAADSFVIEKKKIGFLTFSVAHTARLENVVIDAYTTAPKGVIPGKSPSGSNNSTGSDGQASRMSKGSSGSALPRSFHTLFAEKTFTGFPVSLGNIIALEAAPIVMRFYDDDRLMSEITAAGATIRFPERDIRFRGHVRVRAGAAELTTEQLSFRPEQERLAVEGAYSLRRADTSVSGSRLVTDLQLRRIKR